MIPIEKLYIAASALLTAAAGEADAMGMLSPMAAAVLLFTIIFAFAAIQATRLLRQGEETHETVRTMKQSWYGDPNNKADIGALGRLEQAIVGANTAATAANAEPEARINLSRALHRSVLTLEENLGTRIEALEGKVDKALKSLELQQPRRQVPPGS